MKLLLTSKGITNDSIKQAFRHLLGKKFEESQIAFVTTAGYFTSADKSWFPDEMMSVRTLNPRVFELIEFNSMEKDEILSRLDNSDAVVLSGGNSAALMHAIDKKDLRGVLRKFAEKKVYVGISASSHITSADLKLSTQPKLDKYEQDFGYRATTALGLIDFYVRSHYEEKEFPHINEEYVKNLAQELKKRIIAIDNQSAVAVYENTIDIISEGKYQIFGDS